ncbi:SufS family cysteine desulfurase [Crossiella sp. CA-258035]|uniref:aminotransferase class V-fold PLP-dependent enzyme n=1 Tax=Crossiella sp. CA-258035 TaxID=2981138 RepID=UPI0024BCC9DF|nr:SufS family cysteine desulfurase [Crossiella sp. CA-258035]WHT22944.1 SufS family cysteine desulfurase [Crossiella sp. CA-258035]
MSYLDPAAALTCLDARSIRADFPLLSAPDAASLVYLDSAATTQRPRVVLDAEREFLERSNAACHRGAHRLAERATAAYEDARTAVAAYLGGNPAEVVFTKSATEAINLLAFSLGSPGTGADGLSIGPGDEVVLSELEHHANLVPWQELCRRTGATLRYIPVTADGCLDLAAAEQVIGERTALVSVTLQSNVTGAVTDLEPVLRAARRAGALVAVDACQAAGRIPIDVRALEVDFLVLSSHKMLGPSGIGVLWGRFDLLERMPPFLTGGSMIETVTLTGATYADPPHRFEPGVPPVSQAVGFAAAIDYLRGLGPRRVLDHEIELTRYALTELRALPGVRTLGPEDPARRPGIISFVVDGVHAHDVAQILDDEDIAVRAGHQCAWPLHRALGVTASVRASVHVYNGGEDIDRLVSGVRRVREFFAAQGFIDLEEHR